MCPCILAFDCIKKVKSKLLHPLKNHIYNIKIAPDISSFYSFILKFFMKKVAGLVCCKNSIFFIIIIIFTYNCWSLKDKNIYVERKDDQ